MVRFPMDRVKGRQFFLLPLMPGLGGSRQRSGQWAPCVKGKIIPLKASAPIHPECPERGDGEGDVA